MNNTSNKHKVYKESLEYQVYEEDLSARSQRAYEQAEIAKRQAKYSEWVEAEIAKFSDEDLPEEMLIKSDEDKHAYKLRVITERRGEV